MRNDDATSTRAGAAPEGPEGRWIGALRLLDVAVVLLATAPALALGAPTLGYVVGAAAWLAQRALAALDRRWIGRARTASARLGLNISEAFGRIWLLAGAIVAAGVIGGRADGLTAAVTIFAAYSIAFAMKMFGPPPAPARRPQPAPAARPEAAGPRGLGSKGANGVPAPPREGVLR